MYPDLLQGRRRGTGCQLQVDYSHQSLTVASLTPSRRFTQKQATRIGITGFVKNASDGSVRIFTCCRLQRTDLLQVQGEAQGSDDAIKEFIQHLNKGPGASSVDGVEHSEISTKSGESGFDVK
jgi:acylphosphatase